MTALKQVHPSRFSASSQICRIVPTTLCRNRQPRNDKGSKESCRSSIGQGVLKHAGTIELLVRNTNKACEVRAGAGRFEQEQEVCQAIGIEISAEGYLVDLLDCPTCLESDNNVVARQQIQYIACVLSLRKHSRGCNQLITDPPVHLLNFYTCNYGLHAA